VAWAGRVHTGEGGGAHEGWRFFHDGANVRRNGDDVVGADEADEAVECGTESVEQVVGGGVVLAQFQHYVGGRLGRLQFAGNLLEVGLVLAHIGPGNLKQFVKRDVYHFVVSEFFGEGVGADAEVTVRTRKQVGFQPLEVAGQSGDHRGVGLREFGFGCRVLRIGEGEWHVMFKESHDVR
jgi:hypothetical protein